MGTRSLTRVFDGDKPIACIYRHFDGYPEAHGADLVEMFAKRRIVNGYSSRSTLDRKDMMNGCARVATVIVVELEKDGRDPAIYPPDAKDCWEDYEYQIKCPTLDQINTAGADGLPVTIECYRVHGEGDKRELTREEIPS